MSEFTRLYVRELGARLVVLTRVYEVIPGGRRRLLYRPGDVIGDAEAARLTAPGADLPHNRPGTVDVLRSLEGRDEGPAPAKPKPLERMTLAELRAVAAAERVDAEGLNTRAEYIEAIEAARAAADTKPKG